MDSELSPIRRTVDRWRLRYRFDVDDVFRYLFAVFYVRYKTEGIHHRALNKDLFVNGEASWVVACEQGRFLLSS